MDGVNLIELTSPDGHKVWVNCDKVLYLDIDNSTPETLCVIHLHGQAKVMVKESIFHVAELLKCSH
jgi:hypothetical protein